MKFKLNFDCDNSAFGDDIFSRNEEIKRILLEVSKNLENGYEFFPVYDVNGNKIGKYDTIEDQ